MFAIDFLVGLLWTGRLKVLPLASPMASYAIVGIRKMCQICGLRVGVRVKTVLRIDWHSSAKKD